MPYLRQCALPEIEEGEARGAEVAGTAGVGGGSETKAKWDRKEG